MCVACREMRPKGELIRVVKSQNEFFIDEKGKIEGRGAYICRNEQCIQKALKQKSFNRSFKANVPIEVYKYLEDAFDK